MFIVEEVELRKAFVLSKFLIAALGYRKEVGKREAYWQRVPEK